MTGGRELSNKTISRNNMNKFKTKTKKEIQNLLNSRKLEDPKLIQTIENIFKEQKGHVMKRPLANSHVILMFSGGMDSVTTWAYLMEVYKVHVHPVFLRRGQKRVAFEEKSVDYFSKYYKKRYPKYWHKVKKMNAYIPPMEIRFPIIDVSSKPVNKLGQHLGIPMYTNLLTSYGVQYAIFLKIKENIKVRNIFTAIVAEDGYVMRDETLTAMRTNNLSVCSLMNDYSWQVTSLPLEKEFGFFLSKADLLKWATDQDIPIDRARSCIKWDDDHCGECVSCYVRKIAHNKNKLKDKTSYKKKGLIRGWEKK